MGDDVLVGLLPPRAVRVEDAPGYLPGLLEYLSDPRTAEEVAAYGRDRTDLSAAEVDTLLRELADSGVVSTAEFDPAEVPKPLIVFGGASLRRA